jgi:hypothetical protein
VQGRAGGGRSRGSPAAGTAGAPSAGESGAPAAGESGACQRRGKQGRNGGGDSRGVPAAGQSGASQQGGADDVDNRGATAVWTAGARRRQEKQGHASVHSLPCQIETQGPAHEREVAAGAGSCREDLVGMRRRSARAEEDGRDLGDFFHLFIFLIRGPLCGSKIIFWVFLQNDE